MEVGRDVGGAIVSKAPDRRRKAIGFNAEYLSGEGLIDAWVPVVAVGRGADRSAVLRIHIAPSEVLWLSPVVRRRERVKQLRDLSKVTKRSLGNLHVINDCGTVDEARVPQSSITLALQP